MLGSLVLEARQFLRRIARQKLVYSVAMLAAGASLGAVTLVASVTYVVIFKPLPYRDVRHLFAVEGTAIAGTGTRAVSIGEVDSLRTGWGEKGQVAWFRPRSAVLVDGWKESRAADVSAEFFEVMGVGPKLGVIPLPSNSSAAVVSEALWASYMGRTPDLSTARLRTPAGLLSVAAVMPAAFDWPHGTDMWLVRDDPAEVGKVTSYSLGAVARSSNSSLDVSASMGSEIADNRRLQVVPIDERILGRSRGTILIFSLLSACLFGIALIGLCALVVADLESRRFEWEVKRSCGATSRQVVAGYAVGICGLLFLSSAIGTLAVHLGLPALMAASPVKIARSSEVLEHARQLYGWGILVNFIAFSTLCLVPGVFLRSGSRPKATRNNRLGLIASTQVTCAVAVLVIALAFGKEFVNRQVDIGVPNPERMHYVTLLQKNFDFSAREDISTRFTRTLNRMTAMKGVQTGFVSVVPYSDSSSTTSVWAATVPQLPPVKAQSRVVDSGYLPLMGYQLLSGRLFEQSDREGAPRVVIINSRLKADLGLSEVIGQRVRFADGSPAEVIGLLQDRPDLEDGQMLSRPEIYMPLPQNARVSGSIVVRINADPLIADINRVIADELPDLRIARAGSLAELRDQVVTDPRFFSFVSDLIAAIAVIAALVGMWALVAFAAVSERRRSAILLALGASGARLSWANSARTLAWPVAGTIVGAALGIAILLAVRSRWPMVLPSSRELLILVGGFAITIVLAGHAAWRLTSVRDGALGRHLR